MTEQPSHNHDELVPIESEAEPGQAQNDGSEKSAPEDRTVSGPYDLTEVPAIKPYIDFGSIKILPREGLQIRLEVDQATKRLVAITLDYDGSVLQLQAFSAPKSSGLWHRVRSEIAQQMTAQSSAAQEVQGPLGPELRVITQAPAVQGESQRVVRFIAVDGPRWMLRGVIMGKAAEAPEQHPDIIAIFQDIVVVRGDLPMPPSELLPLQVPPGLTPQSPEEQAAA